MATIIRRGPALDAIDLARRACKVARANVVGPDDVRRLVDEGRIRPVGRAVANGVLVYDAAALRVLVELARARLAEREKGRDL